MRQLQIVVPDEKIEYIMGILGDYAKDPLHIEASGELDTILVHIDESKVDEVVEALRKRGVEDYGSIVILPSTLTLKRKDADDTTPSKGMAPKVELEALAKESSSPSASFYYMTIASAFVATLGLLLDSTAAVIGAMVIAPLLRPAIAICVGTVLGDPKLFRTSLFTTFMGLVLAVGVAMVTAFATIRFGLIPPLTELEVNLPREILVRTDLNVLNIGLALASGAAGAYSFAEGKGETLMGVMIAVALIPPACTAGIGVALWDMSIFGGAGLILLVNVICINIAGTLVLWKVGIRPRRFFRALESGRSMKKRVLTTVAILVIISSLFAYSTYQTYSEYRFKEDIQEEAVAIASGLANVTAAEVDSIDIAGDAITVRMTLLSGAGNIPPDSALTIRDGLEARFGAGYSYEVQVVTETYQTA